MYLGKLKHSNGQRTIARVDARNKLRVSQTYIDDFGIECLASLVLTSEDIGKIREFLDKYEQRLIEQKEANEL